VPRDADEYVALQVVACDGPADEFRIGDEPGSAVRVGGCQPPAMLTSALPLNALPFQGSSVMDWALYYSRRFTLSI
jgi:hypothetical protein